MEKEPGYLTELSSRIHEYCEVLLTEVELDTILSIRIKGLNFWIINSVNLLHVYMAINTLCITTMTF